MESLSDPGVLRTHSRVEFREEQSVCDRDDFEYFAAISGVAAVGITNHSGAVLLMDCPHGWRLPYGPVGTGTDWVDAGRRISEQMTDVEVTVAGVERITRFARSLDGDENRTTTSFDIVFRTVPVTGEPVAADLSFGPWDDLELGWFETVPEDAYWSRGDAVDDIRRFVE